MVNYLFDKKNIYICVLKISIDKYGESLMCFLFSACSPCGGPFVSNVALSMHWVF